MKLSTLNEISNFNVSNNGIVVYLDKENKTFRIMQDEETEKIAKHGLTHTIKTKEDYEKITQQYKINVSFKDWINISNAAKEKNKDIEFRRALALIQKDVVKLHKETRKNGMESI